MKVFQIHGLEHDLVLWIESILSTPDLSTLDLRKVKFCFSTYSSPSEDLQSLVDALQSLRKYVNVEFTFTINEDKVERLRFDAAPLMSKLDALVTEGVVGLDVVRIW